MKTSATKRPKTAAKPEPESEKRRLTIYLPDDLAHKVEIHCATVRTTISAAIQAWIEEGLKRHK